MKIKSFRDTTEFQDFVITTMLAFAPDWFNREKGHEITFTINDVEVDFYKWCDRLEFAFVERAIKTARSIAIENFNDIMTISDELQDELEEMKKDIVTRIRHRLELPTWEERFGE